MTAMKEQSQGLKPDEMMSKVSALGRPLDPRYPSNRLAGIFALAMIILFALIALADGSSFGESIGRGFSAGLVAFLAWALGREIDPDYNMTANVAMVLAMGAFLIWDTGSLLALATLMFALRVLNRSTGLAPLWTDGILIALLAGVSAYNGNWVVGMMVVIAYRISTRLPQSQPKELLFGVITAIATFAGFISGLPVEHTRELDPIWLLVAGIVSVLYVFVTLATPKTFTSRGDYADVPLIRARIVGARLLTIGAGIVWLAWAGESGGTALATVYAIMIGGIVTHGWQLVTKSQ